MKRIDRPTCRLLLEEVAATLAPLALTHDLVVSEPRGRFSPTSLKVTLTLSVKDEAGVAQEPTRTAFSALASLYNLRPEWLDQTFDYRGRRFKVLGLNSRARKMPVIAKDVVSGRSYKFHPATVRRGFNSMRV